MPWSTSDSSKFTKRASTPKLQRQWKAIANSALASGQSESTAIKMASGVVKRAKRSQKRR